jgi:ribosome-binding factor A
MTDPAKVRRQAGQVKGLSPRCGSDAGQDPRLGMITITDSRITADLRERPSSPSSATRTEQAALLVAWGVWWLLLRSTVGRALGLKHSPTIAFVHDDVQETVKHIDELIAAARESDAKVHEIAAGATYAGDAQPYRVAGEGGDDDLADAELSDITLSDRR